MNIEQFISFQMMRIIYIYMKFSFAGVSGVSGNFKKYNLIPLEIECS